MSALAYARENNYDMLSKFESVKEFNNHFEQAMLLYKKHFTKSEYIALNNLRKFAGSDILGVAWCKLIKAVSATFKESKFAGVARRTHERMLVKAKEINLITVYNQERKNGSQKHNVYVFNRIEELVAPVSKEVEIVSKSTTIDVAKPTTIDAPISFLLYLPDIKKLKDTITTKVPEKSEALKNGLLSKLPSIFTKAISPFMSLTDDIHRLVGAIFNGKKSIDKSVRVEQHEDLYYKAIVSVFESKKRAERKGKAFNVFAVMFKAIADVTKAIVTGNAYKSPEVQNNGQAIKLSKEPIPQFMIDNEQDEARKKELQAMKEQQKFNLASRSKEQIPDWFGNRNEASVVSCAQNTEIKSDADFEKLRALAEAKIANLRK